MAAVPDTRVQIQLRVIIEMSMLFEIRISLDVKNDIHHGLHQIVVLPAEERNPFLYTLNAAANAELAPCGDG